MFASPKAKDDDGVEHALPAGGLLAEEFPLRHFPALDRAPVGWKNAVKMHFLDGEWDTGKSDLTGLRRRTLKKKRR